MMPDHLARRVVPFAWLFLLLLHAPAAPGQSLYFPPVSGATWDTVAPSSLGWCANYIDTLSQYLADKNTKAFIVLKDGKIAIERYYGTFTQDSIWYWASAGKSLTAFLAGIAMHDGYFGLHDTVSHILGPGWTSCMPADEEKITVLNQITMTCGFNDSVPDPDCTADTCLACMAPAGGRWAYHNAPYHLVHDVMETSIGSTLNQYTFSQLSFSTGITGLWYDHVFYSTPRSMARFGLLTLAGGAWNGNVILNDTAYLHQMLQTSQPINESYGYLWWLNGKNSFMLPQSQFVFNGPLFPDAPADMVAALGKNDQKIYIVPSQNLVVVRMGENSGTIPYLAVSSFDNVLWQKLNDVFCTTLSLDAPHNDGTFRVFPNPAHAQITLDLPAGTVLSELRIFDFSGRQLMYFQNPSHQVDLGNLREGCYLLQAVTHASVNLNARFVVVP